MVQDDRPILIDMHQGPGLIEPGERKGNPELHRRQGNAALQDRIPAIPRRNLGLPGAVLAGFLQLRHQLMADEILHLHMEGRGLGLRIDGRMGAAIALARPRPAHPVGVVKVQQPHIQRLTAHGMGNVIQHPLDPHHALRAAKAAIGGGALGVGAQPVAFDADIAQVIAIVGMQHGPVRHRQGQILAPAAAEEMRELHPQNPPLSVMADAIGNPQIMPLAGDHHVIVAVIAHLAGPPRGARRHGAGNGQSVALRFLAAKAAAHPARLHPHRRHRQMQRMGHLVLNLGRMLGGGDNRHPTILTGQGKGHLTFKVKMLLPADLETALSHQRRAGNGACRIALGPDHRALLKARIGGQRLIHRQDRRQLVIGHAAQPRGLPRGQMAFGHDKENRLADIMHPARGQQRLIVNGWRAIRHIWPILGREHRHHTGGGTHRRKVHLGDHTMGAGGQAKGQMQGPCRQRHIIGIAGGPRDMQRRRIMRQRFTHAHGCTSRTETGLPARSWA